MVTLANGQTSITTATDIVDARDLLGDGDRLPVPITFGQILMYDDGGIQWVFPLTDENGNIITNQDGQIVYEG